jgi:hypothetical protein
VRGRSPAVEIELSRRRRAFAHRGAPEVSGLKQRQEILMNTKTKIAALVVASCLPFQALAANTWGTDYSDLWYNPEASGWGANIAHQGDTIFMTIFVYAADGSARWYVGPAMGSNGGDQEVKFMGTLYEMRGPYFGTYFNPREVDERQAGSVSVTFPDGYNAMLSYSVDGVYQTKWIKRQTFRNNSLNGYYIGATSGSTSGCVAGTDNFAYPSQFTFNQSGADVVMTVSKDNAPTCTVSGAYAQRGRMGDVVGRISCSNGRNGSFQAFEIEAGAVGFTGRYNVDYGSGCTEAGRIGGVK